jgi:hypothetical protein
MNRVKLFFLDLTLLSRTSPVDVIHEGVTPWALARLGGLARVRWATLAGATTHQSSHAISVGATLTSVTSYQSAWLLYKIGQTLSFSFFLLSFLLLSSLLNLRQLYLRFGVLSPNPSPRCHKLTSWVGILIILDTYVVFTILFSCILKISLGWTMW